MAKAKTDFTDYITAFEDELSSFIKRVEDRAKARIEKAKQEAEEVEILYQFELESLKLQCIIHYIVALSFCHARPWKKIVQPMGEIVQRRGGNPWIFSTKSCYLCVCFPCYTEHMVIGHFVKKLFKTYFKA